MLIAVPKAFRLGASWAARKYAGPIISAVSADAVRIRLMPSRYVGDMCSRPSTSLPLLMRCSVVASVFSSTGILFSSTWGRQYLVLANAFEVAAATRAAVLAQQQLRAE